MKERTEKQKAKLDWYLKVRKLREEKRAALLKSAIRIACIKLMLDAEQNIQQAISSQYIPPPLDLFFEEGGEVRTPPGHYQGGVTVQIAPGQNLSDEMVENLSEKIKRLL